MRLSETPLFKSSPWKSGPLRSGIWRTQPAPRMEIGIPGLDSEMLDFYLAKCRTFDTTFLDDLLGSQIRDKVKALLKDPIALTLFSSPCSNTLASFRDAFLPFQLLDVLLSRCEEKVSDMPKDEFAENMTRTTKSLYNKLVAWPDLLKTAKDDQSRQPTSLTREEKQFLRFVKAVSQTGDAALFNLEHGSWLLGFMLTKDKMIPTADDMFQHIVGRAKKLNISFDVSPCKLDVSKISNSLRVAMGSSVIAFLHNVCYHGQTFPVLQQNTLWRALGSIDAPILRAVEDAVFDGLCSMVFDGTSAQSALTNIFKHTTVDRAIALSKDHPERARFALAVLPVDPVFALSPAAGYHPSSPDWVNILTAFSSSPPPLLEESDTVPSDSESGALKSQSGSPSNLPASPCLREGADTVSGLKPSDPNIQLQSGSSVNSPLSVSTHFRLTPPPQQVSPISQPVNEVSCSISPPSEQNTLISQPINEVSCSISTPTPTALPASNQITKRKSRKKSHPIRATAGPRAKRQRREQSEQSSDDDNRDGESTSLAIELDNSSGNISLNHISLYIASNTEVHSQHAFPRHSVYEDDLLQVVNASFSSTFLCPAIPCGSSASSESSDGAWHTPTALPSYLHPDARNVRWSPMSVSQTYVAPADFWLQSAVHYGQILTYRNIFAESLDQIYPLDNSFFIAMGIPRCENVIVEDFSRRTPNGGVFGECTLRESLDMIEKLDTGIIVTRTPVKRDKLPHNLFHCSKSRFHGYGEYNPYPDLRKWFSVGSENTRTRIGFSAMTTILIVDDGQILLCVAKAKHTNFNDLSFEMDLVKQVDWEMFLLHTGNVFFLRPNTLYCYYHLKRSLIRGVEMFTTPNVMDSISGVYRKAFAAPQEMPVILPLLTRMFSFWYTFLVADESLTNGYPLHDSCPNPESWLGMLTIISVGNVVVLALALDYRCHFSCLPRQESDDHEKCIAHIMQFRRWAISQYHVCGPACTENRLEWVFNQSLLDAAVSLTTRHRLISQQPRHPNQIFWPTKVVVEEATMALKRYTRESNTGELVEQYLSACAKVDTVEMNFIPMRDSQFEVTKLQC
ncbi:hypothetical protein B0H12DRAFT_1074103 [Mycena haematopus]|nr:hypothetical protein B0H12DRAFT_1074103 [Mycena haematopus]